MKALLPSLDTKLQLPEGTAVNSCLHSLWEGSLHDRNASASFSHKQDHTVPWHCSLLPLLPMVPWNSTPMSTRAALPLLMVHTVLLRGCRNLTSSYWRTFSFIQFSFSALMQSKHVSDIVSWGPFCFKSITIGRFFSRRKMAGLWIFTMYILIMITKLLSKKNDANSGTMPPGIFQKKQNGHLSYP